MHSREAWVLAQLGSQHKHVERPVQLGKNDWSLVKKHFLAN